MTAVIQIFVYPDAWTVHIVWAAILIHLIRVGGGALAMMSFLDDNEIERIFKVNAERCREKYPNYSEANARKTIARARQRGFVISDVIELPGVRSIAVPLRDKNNVPIAGISVSTLTTRMDKARSDLALSEITKAIEQIQQHLLTAEPD
jgi:DNA-binding IclR family transcriptional regulator